MSEEKSSSPGLSEAPTDDVAAKRRVSKSRAAKHAKSAKAESAAEKSAPPFPVFDEAESGSSSDSPESSVSSETSPQDKNKRKRRRKKGKGGISPNVVQTSPEDGSSEPVEEISAGDLASPPRPARQSQPKLDPESVAKLAWKIYLAEVSEEGVALIGDSDAKELSRRCFRLAEIFMEEQSRRR